jgi:aarF domain-containing kinase
MDGVERPTPALRTLPKHRQAARFLIVAWNFLLIYFEYKRYQRTRHLPPEKRALLLAETNRRAAERLYRLAIRMEGLLIKACQFISSRADVAPPEYISVLSRLQDQVPPRPYRVVRQQIRKELGQYPEDIFRSFAVRPIASASLAQVHRAELHDGRVAAVKVQYPDIERIVETDMRNVSLLVRLLARLEPNFDFTIVMDEMRRTVPRELDFRIEADSAEQVARDMAHRPDVRVPEIYREYSARRVMTMEFIEGTKISDIDRLLELGIDPNQVALIMTEAFCEQVLVHGFFHADPHPGNLLVQSGPVVVFLDFGLAKSLPPDFRLNYARLTLAIMSQDPEGMVEAFRKIGFRTRKDSPESLIALGMSFFESSGPDNKPYLDSDVMPEVNERLARILQENPVTEIPPDILLIFRVIGLMSGLQRRLDSRVNLIDTITPYAERQAEIANEAAAIIASAN